MAKRTEEDKIVQADIEVILGGREFKIRPLVIREAREWRKKAIKLISTLPKYTNVTSDNAEGFEQALSILLIDMPDEVLDLFFAYAKELDRDEIEGIATEDEVAKAFEEVVKVAFPLAQSLPQVMARLSR